MTINSNKSILKQSKLLSLRLIYGDKYGGNKNMKRFKIILKNDDRIHEGTSLEIIDQMKYLAWGWENKPVTDYIDWMIEKLKTFPGIEVNITEKTLEMKAEQFIAILIKHNLACEI